MLRFQTIKNFTYVISQTIKFPMLSDILDAKPSISLNISNILILSFICIGQEMFYVFIQIQIH